MSSWWKRMPAPETVAAEVQVQELDEVRKIRKSMFIEIMEKLEQLPLVEGIEGVGRDLGKRNAE